jgi:hypothetical protein
LNSWIFWIILKVYSSHLKGQCHEIFCFWFFHEPVSPQPQSIPFRPFRIFSKIRGDIRESRCTTGINDTGGKFATGVNDTGGKMVWYNQRLGGNWFKKKTRSKKSRDTVPLKLRMQKKNSHFFL